jgi:hypothetical protein
MTGTLETLRDALLLTLIVILLYVMYKRLLRVLGKDQVNVPRVNFLPATGTIVDGSVIIAFESPDEHKVMVQIQATDANEVFASEEVLPVKGENKVVIPIGNLKPGGYLCTLRSDNHTVYRRFETPNHEKS